MGIFSTTPCDEIHGSAREDWSQGAIECAVRLRCAWSVRYALVADLLGTPRPWPNATYVTTPFARAASISPEPGKYVQNGQQIEYADAFVDVGYSAGQVEDVLSESIEPAVEFLTTDPLDFEWKTADPDTDKKLLKDGEAPGKLFKTVNIVRTFFRVEPPLTTDLINLAGSVNDKAETSVLLGLTFETGTLLYHPPNLSRTIKSDGSGFAFNVTMKFTYKKSTWNKFWRSSLQDFDTMAVKSSGADYDNYPLADFTNIWTL